MLRPLKMKAVHSRGFLRNHYQGNHGVISGKFPETRVPAFCRETVCIGVFEDIDVVAAYCHVGRGWTERLAIASCSATPRGSITERDRYGADLYQTGGKPTIGQG